jgi:hypothetical protein
MYLSFAADQPGGPISAFAKATADLAEAWAEAGTRHGFATDLRSRTARPPRGGMPRPHRVRIETRHDRHERLCLRGEVLAWAVRESLWRSGGLGSPDRARSQWGSREVERSSRQTGATRPSSGRRRVAAATTASQRVSGHRNGIRDAAHANASAVQNRSLLTS